MVEQSSQKAPPQDTISQHITTRSTTELPRILTDYFKPKTRAEIRLTRPKLQQELQRHRQKIHPIVRISPSASYGGFTHGAFPKTYFHFWLLTEDQLDSLAAFYHQDVQGRWSDQYPKRMRWRADLSYEDKRMEFGRFLGLRGCDRPYGVGESVEGFKKGVEELVGGWGFAECEGERHRPGHGLVVEVVRRMEREREEERRVGERVRRERVRVLVERICGIDRALREMGVDPEMCEKQPPTYEEACPGRKKSWRSRLQYLRGKK